MRAVAPAIASALASALTAGLLLAAQAAWSQPKIDVKPVQFKPGTSSAALKGSITGSQTIDYTLRAAAGQTMTVSFKPANPSGNFNVLAPGTEEALFIGSSSGAEFKGVLPADGVYKVRLYLMGSASKSTKPVPYSIDIGVTGAPKKP